MKKAKEPSSHPLLEVMYKDECITLLILVFLSAVNMIILGTGGDSYYLFSAFIPYAVIDLGMLFCGRYPADYYGEDSILMSDTLEPSAFVVFVVIAAVLLALYVLCWLFSRKLKIGWLVFALIYFLIDTGLMVFWWGIEDSILDIILHGIMIISLIVAIITGHLLKKKLAEDAREGEARKYPEVEIK